LEEEGKQMSDKNISICFLPDAQTNEYSAFIHPAKPSVKENDFQQFGKQEG
jgi:hypothetical protein